MHAVHVMLVMYYMYFWYCECPPSTPSPPLPSLYNLYYLCVLCLAVNLCACLQVLDATTWPVTYPMDIPQQTNAFDCGVFTIM